MRGTSTTPYRRPFGSRLIPVLGGLCLVAVVVVAAVAPWLSPQDPYAQDPAIRLLPPFSDRHHVLGTDYLGRDTLSRLIWGGRASLTVGILTAAVAGTIGVTLGVTGGFYGGFIGSLVSAIINVRLAFPVILLALSVVSLLGAGLRNTTITLSATLWVRYAIVARSQVLVLREQEFVAAARATGAVDSYIIRRHLVPNMFNSILVVAGYGIAEAILYESFLSFLGLGVQLPTPSWGNMLAEAREYALSIWWMAAFPGVAIFLTTLSVIVVSDGIRAYWDPIGPNSRTDA